MTPAEAVAALVAHNRWRHAASVAVAHPTVMQDAAAALATLSEHGGDPQLSGIDRGPQLSFVLMGPFIHGVRNNACFAAGRHPGWSEAERAKLDALIAAAKEQLAAQAPPPPPEPVAAPEQKHLTEPSMLVRSPEPEAKDGQTGEWVHEHIPVLPVRPHAVLGPVSLRFIRFSACSGALSAGERDQQLRCPRGSRALTQGLLL